MSEQLKIKMHEGPKVRPTQPGGRKKVPNLAHLTCVKKGRLYFLAFDADKVSEQRARRSFRWHLERDETLRDPKLREPAGVSAHYLYGKAVFGEAPIDSDPDSLLWVKM